MPIAVSGVEPWSFQGFVEGALKDKYFDFDRGRRSWREPFSGVDMLTGQLRIAPHIACCGCETRHHPSSIR